MKDMWYIHNICCDAYEFVYSYIFNLHCFLLFVLLLALLILICIFTKINNAKIVAFKAKDALFLYKYLGVLLCSFKAV